MGDLGSGATSIVKLGESKETKSKVAIKCITEATHPSFRSNTTKVIGDILKACSHPNIATLVDLFEEKEGLFVVLELYAGPLTKVLQQSQNLVWTEKDACRIITQILETTQYIHSLGIIHGDLTTGNILSADANATQIKISGFTKAQKEETESDIFCEPYFKAPELLEGKKHGKSVDLWAIGCMSFLLLSGKYPFADSNLMRLNANIKNGKFEFAESDWAKVDPKAKEFVKGLLNVNPQERTTMEKALQDPWITGGGSGEVLTAFAVNLKGNKFTH
uniref:Protein kinase domain-containing protein n=1 Tax=Arcella intermedia TaxID=1963864 RepID=A0A6B2LD94_9EUKA